MADLVAGGLDAGHVHEVVHRADQSRPSSKSIPGFRYCQPSNRIRTTADRESETRVALTVGAGPVALLHQFNSMRLR